MPGTAAGNLGGMSAWDTAEARQRRQRPAVARVDMVSMSDSPDQVEQALLALGVPADADPEEAGRRYRQLMRACHPDVRGHSALEQAKATDEAARVNAAWAVVRPAAEAFARHRADADAAQRRRREPVASWGGSRPTARIIRADAVQVATPRVIPIPDGASLHSGAV